MNLKDNREEYMIGLEIKMRKKEVRQLYYNLTEIIRKRRKEKAVET